MAVDTARFERLGLRIPLDEFNRLVEEAVEEFLPNQPACDPRQAMTEEEVRLLRESSVSLSPSWSELEAPLVRTAAEYAGLVASALSVAEAARVLSVDSSRVRQRLAARTLYGVKQRSGWRLPRFQFAGQRLVPSFDRIAPVLAGIDPVSVARWFTRPHVDLVVGDSETPVAPRDWLEMGRDPETVVRLARELHGVA